MKKSLYTYLFDHNDTYYLYNSLTGFLGTISGPMYEALYNNDLEALTKDELELLKDKGIVVENDHIYDYYYTSRFEYLSSIG